MEENPNILKVSYDSAIQEILAGSIQYAGILNVHNSSGQEFQNTYIPPTYTRHSRKQNRRRDPHYNYYYSIGEDNLFPNFLLDLKGRSAMLTSMIEATADAAMGKGLVIFKEGEKKGQVDVDKQDFKAWLKKIGVDSQFIKMLFENICTFKGVYVEYVYGDKMNEDADVMPGLESVYCVNFQKGRVGIRNEWGEIDKYWMHRDAFDTRRRGSRAHIMSIQKLPEPQKAFEIAQSKEPTVLGIGGRPFYDGEFKDLGVGRFMSFHYLPSISSDEYPICDFATDSAINAAIIDAYLPQFDVAALENGLSVGHIVTVPLARPRKGDKAGDEKYEKDKVSIREDIQKTMQGVENTDNVLVVYVDPRSDNQPITIAEVPNNNSYETLNEKDERKERTLLAAFRVRHPALVGLAPRSGKGLNSQTGILHEAEGQWYTSFVYKRTEIIQDFFNSVLLPIWEYEERAGASTGLEVRFPLDQRFKQDIPVEVILKAFTVQMIFNHYGIDQEYTEDLQRTLVKDLITRSLGGNTADPVLLEALGIIPKIERPEPIAPIKQEPQEEE